MKVPVRTCVGCKARAEQPELIRFRLEENRVTFGSKNTSGRGAWLHAREACLLTAVKRRAFGRALRRPNAEIDVPRLRLELTGNARKY